VAYVITRLCRDCVDGACVKACPVDCIVEHRPKDGPSHLPNQFFIDPEQCICCDRCLPECPWEAIYRDDDVPEALAADIALNALSAHRDDGFVVPTERLLRRPSAEEVEANRGRWLGESAGRSPANWPTNRR
jgi:ferredoxin